MPCYMKPTESGILFMNGDLGPHCEDCNDVGENLCDYPVGEGKTCDRSMCETHSHEIGPDLHYCGAHLAAWREFEASGGLRRELSTVISFNKMGRANLKHAAGKGGEK